MNDCCALQSRIDALTREVAFFKDAAAAFCADLMCVEAECDALKAAQRKPLTDEQHRKIIEENTTHGYDGDYYNAYGIANDIEAAHGIKEPA